MSYTPSCVIPSSTKQEEEKETKGSVAPSVALPKGNKMRETNEVYPPVVNQTEKALNDSLTSLSSTLLNNSNNPVPASIAEEYARIQELYYFPLEDARDELYKAYHDDKQSEVNLYPLVTKVIQLTRALDNFWERYHVAEDIENGKKVDEEFITKLENEKEKFVKNLNNKVQQRELSSYSKTEIDEMIKNNSVPQYIIAQGLTIVDIKNERIKRNIKYLRRNDRKAGSDYRESLSEAATELHDWGEKITEAMERACALYGYEIPAGWVTRPKTKEQRAAEKNEANKRRYAEKTAVARELKEELKKESQA